MTEFRSVNWEEPAMSPPVRELLEKLRGLHVANLQRLNRLDRLGTKMGEINGDRMEDFIAREQEQIDLISAALDRDAPTPVTLTSETISSSD